MSIPIQQLPITQVITNNNFDIHSQHNQISRKTRETFVREMHRGKKLIVTSFWNSITCFVTPSVNSITEQTLPERPVKTRKKYTYRKNNLTISSNSQFFPHCSRPPSQHFDSSACVSPVLRKRDKQNPPSRKTKRKRDRESEKNKDNSNDSKRSRLEQHPLLKKQVININDEKYDTNKTYDNDQLLQEAFDLIMEL